MYLCSDHVVLPEVFRPLHAVPISYAILVCSTCMRVNTFPPRQCFSLHHANILPCLSWQKGAA